MKRVSALVLALSLAACDIIGGYTSSSSAISIRASQVDIDWLYAEGDRKEQDKNINRLIEELSKSNFNTVFLQAWCDDDTGVHGNIESVYFYTTHAPVRADIFGYISGRLKAEGFTVIAWMHTLSCQWLMKDGKNKMEALPKENAGWYDRATPFSEETTNSLLGLFDDLSRYSEIDGVLFQDDLYMNDFEDFSVYAKEAFYKEFRRELNEDIFNDKELLNRYTNFKTETLLNLTETLMEKVRENIPSALSMRNLYSTLITEPESEEWFAQNFGDFVDRYDYTVVMAYPYLEEDVEDPGQWMRNVASKAVEYAGVENKNKVIMKIQTYDWSTERWLPDAEINDYLTSIKSFGLQYAIYPHKRLR